MQTTETFHIIIVEPIMTEADLVAARHALDLLEGAEPGSPESTKRDHVMRMIREYERRAEHAVREAGDASAAWASRNRSRLGWIAGGLSSLAALGYGAFRWRQARQQNEPIEQVRGFARRVPSQIARTSRRGWTAARNRIEGLVR